MRMFIKDRLSLRIDRKIDDKYSSPKAAFVLGRLLNELRFHYCCQWIGHPEDRLRCGILLGDVAVLLQQAGCQPETVTETERRLVSELDRLKQDIESRDHLDMLEAINFNWDRHYEDDVPDHFQTAIAFLAPVKAAFDLQSKLFARHLNESTLPAFHVGEHIDQLIHPRVSSTTHVFAKLIENFTKDLLWSTEGSSEPIGLSDLLQNNHPWVDAAWCRTLSNLLTSLLDAHQTELIQRDCSILPHKWMDKLDDLLDEVPQAGFTTDRLNSRVKRNLRRAGMLYDPETGVLRYENERKELKGLYSRLLTLLLNQQSPISERDLADDWIKVSGNSGQGKNVRTAISRLRSEIELFPISIITEAQKGYVVSIRSASASASFA